MAVFRYRRSAANFFVCVQYHSIVHSNPLMLIGCSAALAELETLPCDLNIDRAECPPLLNLLGERNRY